MLSKRSWASSLWVRIRTKKLGKPFVMCISI